jgi:hypothetical protein
VGACGNSISDTTGSGGGTGGNGSPASSSKATTGGMGGSGGTIGTGGSGTGGAGDACSMACMHAAQCGEDLCSQFPLDCSTQEGMCASTCVNGASCQDIMDAVAWFTSMQGPPPQLVDCLAPCVQGGAGGGGQGGAGGGSQACQNCALNDCSGPIGTCAQDQACQGWFNCAMGCGFNDNTCLTNCDTMNPGAATDYDAIYQCACDSCKTECSQIDACSHLPGSGASTGTM